MKTELIPDPTDNSQTEMVDPTGSGNTLKFIQTHPTPSNTRLPKANAVTTITTNLPPLSPTSSVIVFSSDPSSQVIGAQPNNASPINIISVDSTSPAVNSTNVFATNGLTINDSDNQVIVQFNNGDSTTVLIKSPTQYDGDPSKTALQSDHSPLQNYPSILPLVATKLSQQDGNLLNIDVLLLSLPSSIQANYQIQPPVNGILPILLTGQDLPDGAMNNDTGTNANANNFFWIFFDYTPAVNISEVYVYYVIPDKKDDPNTIWKLFFTEFPVLINPGPRGTYVAVPK